MFSHSYSMQVECNFDRRDKSHFTEASAAT